VARQSQMPSSTRFRGQGDAKVLAAGGFLWRGDPSGPARDREIAIVHRPKYDDWSMPKGKVDEGEQLVVTACREVCEETGATASAGQVIGEQRYRVAAGMKYVRYWAMEYAGGDFVEQDEVDELRWMPTPDAIRKVSYDHDQQLAQRFADTPIATATILVVRHASAGKRRRWKGDDKLRPLDSDGVAQAARLSVVAPCYAPVRIASADLLRCADTVRQVSLDLGIPVSIEPALSSAAHASNPKKTVDWLREQIDAGGTTMLCSQGEVIPDLLTRISAGAPVRLRRPPARKGSVWALSFADGKLVGADYDADLAPAQTR
jgi:8-oxo-dGTP pyrophosphatase MutT (NUDIX family)/phosphohistidine phosphatase SixA